MNYIYETEDKNYEDFASGRVFYNQQGATSFPVRLASEIFQRCAGMLEKAGVKGPYSVYDPCCGGAYLLTSIGFLHSSRIFRIYASDIDEKMVSLAERNLSLLSAEGLAKREEQIRKMLEEFGKASHTEALESVIRFKNLLHEMKPAIGISCFTADATKEINLNAKVDIVITDLPYGNIVQWGGIKDEDAAVKGLLDNLLPVLSNTSVVAAISNKSTKIKHEQYKKVEQFKIGKRQVTFLQSI